MKNPKYFSSKNNVEIKDIKSQNKYYFIADCDHEFLSLPTNVFIDNKLHCPVCSRRQVLIGVNDMWTTNPEMAALLKNPEDGYKYTIGSNKKLEWLCTNCKIISTKSPAKMKESVSKCQYCNKISSYGEKFITEMLFQLRESFEPEKEFYWSDGKRYDFYLPLYSCIIEVPKIEVNLNED